MLFTLIAGYLGGLILWSCVAIFDPPWGKVNWYDYFYYWHQDVFGCGWLVWILIYKLIGNTYKSLVLPLVYLSLTIFIWDLISYPTGWGVNNPIATGIAFGAATMIVIIYMIVDLRKKWKSKQS